MLLLTSCSTSAVQENANFVPVQPLPNPNVASEKIQNPKTESQTFPNIPFPSPEKSNIKWEDSYFKEIIKREKPSNLKRLKSKVLPEDDLELRIWSGFGLSLLEGLVLRRTSGEWSALHLDWEVSEKHDDKRNIKPLDKKLDAPASGWDTAWQKPIDAGIFTLPSPTDINCSGNAFDGFTYVIEYKLNNKYRTYMYDNPEYAKCDEAKRMVKINKIIAEEFYKREIKVDDGK